MNRADIEQLAVSALAKREKAIEAANTEYRKAVDAIRIVKGMLAEASSQPATTTTERGGQSDETPQDAAGAPAAVSSSRGRQMAVVKKALQVIGGRFTVDDIDGVVHSVSPDYVPNRIALSKCLIRLLEKGALVQIEKGGGQRPSIYEKATNGSLVQEGKAA